MTLLQHVEDLQALLRCLNPKVTTIRAAKGEVTRAQEIDAIMSENAFSDEDLLRARTLGLHGYGSYLLSFSQSVFLQLGAILMR